MERLYAEVSGEIRIMYDYLHSAGNERIEKLERQRIEQERVLEKQRLEQEARLEQMEKQQLQRERRLETLLSRFAFWLGFPAFMLTYIGATGGVSYWLAFLWALVGLVVGFVLYRAFGRFNESRRR